MHKELCIADFWFSKLHENINSRGIIPNAKTLDKSWVSRYCLTVFQVRIGKAKILGEREVLYYFKRSMLFIDK